MNYIDKYKGNFGRNSIYDILSLNPNIPQDWEVIKREYLAVDMEKVVIDGDTFTNYGDFQFVWEKSYVKDPERSGKGVIDNLNAYATFITPHLIINFSIMSIDDYRAIMRKDLERNEFVVECYDPIYNGKVTAKMYFGTPEMAKLFTINKLRFDGENWEEFIELAGVREYTVEMIGTNADLDLISVVYHLNPPADTGASDATLAEDDVYKGEDLIIGGAASEFTSETFNGKYKFSKWNISAENPTVAKDHGNYLDGYAYTINTNLVLYAQWQSVTDHTLTFNYGLADPAINDEELSYEDNRKVVYGASIGALPIPKPPVVKYKGLDGVEYEKDSVYHTPQWWKVPQKVKKYDEDGNDITSTLIVYDNEPYWRNKDSTIYLLYETNKYLLTLFIDGEVYQHIFLEYNSSVNLPSLVKNGYTLDGWYVNSDYSGAKWSGTNMPPYSLGLYARWKKND